MTSPSEDVKTASSRALGAVSVGNLPLYLPRLLQQIATELHNPKQEYILLQALSEVIKSVRDKPGLDIAAGKIAVKGGLPLYSLLYFVLQLPEQRELVCN